MWDSTGKANEQKDEPASEQCIVESAGVFCEATVVLKGLPSNHPRAFCMGEYTTKDRKLNGRSLYVGGRDGDMALYFDNTDWVVTYEDTIGAAAAFFMYVDDCAITPDRIKTPWMVNQGKQPAPSLRVRKFRGRETILEVSGLPSNHYASSCVGRYTREICSHNEKPTYKGSRLADEKAIWFYEGCWRVGRKEDIGTLICFIAVKDCARTPDAVRSTWKETTGAEYDERVQVCGASTQQTSSATASDAQLSSAPPKLAVVGTSMACENYDGVYTKQQRKTSSKVVYEGGRNGKQAFWYLQAGGWVLGQAEDIGTGVCQLQACDHTAIPDAIIEPWNLPLMVPCSSVRVAKSKKKHSNVIEVKGVPDCNKEMSLGGYEELALMNGKYRQSRMVGGRLMFKGGQDGRRAIWFDERHGKWRGSHVDSVGAGGISCIEATDMAAAPSAVKASWNVYNGVKPSPYPNVIVPSVEAAKQEVLRLVRLKMCELVVAQHMRCLGCGHEYTAQSEVVFQMECMHHHCMCCAEKHDGNGCAVCAEEGKV
jgi:hypothetical protein